MLRAKAIVRDELGLAYVVQLAGLRCEVTPLRPAGPAQDAPRRGFGLVCIGLSGQLDEVAIDAALAASRL